MIPWNVSLERYGPYFHGICMYFAMVIGSCKSYFLVHFVSKLIREEKYNFVRT